MASNGKSQFGWALGVLGAIVLGLGGFVLQQAFGVHARLAVMEAALEQIVSDTEADARRDETLSKHWRLHSWAKDRVTELRNMHNQPLVEWPELNP